MNEIRRLTPAGLAVCLGLASSVVQASAALPWVGGDRYEGGHWLGTFAVYLLAAEGKR